MRCEQLAMARSRAKGKVLECSRICGPLINDLWSDSMGEFRESLKILNIFADFVLYAE